MESLLTFRVSNSNLIEQTSIEKKETMLKKNLMILTSIFILTSLCSEIFGQSIVKNEEDEFTGNRVIQSSSERIEHEGFTGRAFVSAFYNEGSYFLILEVYSSDSWQLLSANTTNFIIDDDRKEYELLRIDTDTSSGGTIEQYGIILSASEFEKFGNAEDLRFRANRNIYTITQEAKDSFLLVLNELQE